MDPRDIELADLPPWTRAVLDRIGEARVNDRLAADALVSEPFMRQHTDFESFAGFCEASPWPLEEPREIRSVPRRHLDRYVERTTDFESWNAMRTRAAEEAIVEQYVP